jgi:predicted alpha-1,2-mannosidase
VAVAVALGLPAVPSLAGGSQPPAAVAADVTSLVNPLSGTLGAGFPTVAAGVPFGMATPGPATTTPAGDDPVNYIGYAYQDPEIRGFAVNHFSGAGVHIGGELPMLPVTGSVTTNDPRRFASPYEHATETAAPGYYAVTLDRYQTRVELTATPRVALERYTFPAGLPASVLLDVTRDNDGVQSGWMRARGDRTVEGVVDIGGDNVGIYFTARFDRPFTTTGTWSGSTLTPGGRQVSGKGVGGWVGFGSAGTRTVGVRIGMSYDGLREARANLAAEAPPSTSFDAVRARAHAAWLRRLSAVDVTGGSTAQRQTFYTALYHAMLLPEVFDDADGSYLGFDHRVHRVPAGHHHYTDLSLWDTFRTQTPLLALVAPDVAHDVGTSVLADADQNAGVIPQWVYADVDTGTMGGDSGTPTLATLVADGILRGASARHAWRLLLHQATALPPVPPRRHLDDYLAKGYIPTEDDGIAAPLTLEYAVDDAAVASVARRFGTAQQVAAFTRRAGAWRHLMDPQSHFLRPRNRDGSWATPTNLGVRKVWNPAMADGWQEGTGWQWLWQVPQDVPALARAMGGRSTALSRLDHFFGTAASSETAPAVPLAQDEASFFGVYYVGDQYTPGNETDLQAPWLYDWLGQPWKTARVVHAESQVFNATPYGLPGNDDAGSMSAWYVLAALGLYQTQPGVPDWELSTPMFPAATVRDPAGRLVLRIVAPGAGPSKQYVDAAWLGRAPLRRDWLSDAALRSGQTLRFRLAASPGSWATAGKDAPPTIGPQAAGQP